MTKTTPTLLAMLLCVAAAGTTYAWLFPTHGTQAVQTATATLGLWSSPLPAADWTGSYADPNHPNCQRVVQVAGSLASVSGTDGAPACPADGSGRAWALEGKLISSNTILVDFTPKGGPANLQGVYESAAPAGILWPDGNKWIKQAPNY
jgi:hypothetical protein